VVVGMRVLLLFALLCISLPLALGLKTCNEEEGCKSSPSGTSCRCWSTCGVSTGYRECGAESVNDQFTVVSRVKDPDSWVGSLLHSDMGCSYIPGAGNKRDLCEWSVDASKTRSTCVEDAKCSKAPVYKADTCECWSTCGVTQGNRKCGPEGVNNGWMRYTRAGNDGTSVDGNTVGFASYLHSYQGCTSIPGAGNMRDLCIFHAGLRGETGKAEL